MQSKKEYILEKSFEVFMAKGYDSASMTVLQKELGISRGAMYRYFDSKDALFRAVIDKYFFSLLAFINPEIKEGMTVAKRIAQKCKKLKEITLYFQKIEGFDIVFFNFTALIIQAAKHYPCFIESMEIHKNLELERWMQVLESGIKTGEVRADVDVKMMAKIFSKAIDASDSESSDKKLATIANETKEMMNYIYSLIKA